MCRRRSPLRCTRWRGRRTDAVICVIDVAAPGRSAHHPAITPAGVICGDRDQSPTGRGVHVTAHACLQHGEEHRGRAPGSSCPASFSLIVKLPFPGRPFRAQAGLAQAGGRHQEHQSGLPADCSLWRPAERCALSPVGCGMAISWLRTDLLSSVQRHGSRATWDAAPRAGERSQIHPAAGDRGVMPGRHPQPRVGVNATYTRQVR